MLVSLLIRLEVEAYVVSSKLLKVSKKELEAMNLAKSLDSQI
jgi:hypothetical protein